MRSAADFAIDPVTLSAPLIILIALPNSSKESKAVKAPVLIASIEADI